MDCCDRVLDEVFDGENARRRLHDYRRSGATGSTRRLLDHLRAGGVTGWTVLEIGGGVGAVHLGLLDAGASSATDVDASSGFVAAAREEAARRGYGERVRHLVGDAVAKAAELEPADLVALDRVVCCYPDVEALMGLAAGRARRRLGVVMPRDGSWVGWAVRLANAWEWLNRRTFRMHAHGPGRVTELATQAGLQATYRHRGWFWETLVFDRAEGSPTA
jgi:hypothetical protein